MAFARISENYEFSKGVNSYEGTIVVEGEGQIRRQSAKKLPCKVVKKLFTDFGDQWIKELLLSNGALADMEVPNK